MLKHRMSIDEVVKITGLRIAEIKEIIRWIGMCSVDTIFLDGDKPVLGRMGIGLMLTVTLLEFPDYYMKYELSQFN